MRLRGVETHFTGPKHTNPADWWRTIGPLNELKKHVDWDIVISRALVSQSAAKNLKGKQSIDEWTNLARDNDLIYYSYNTNGMNYSFARVFSKKYRRALVMDFDDNVLKPDFSNPTEITSRMNRPIEDLEKEVVIEDVPFITTTSEYIKKDYMDFLAERKIKKNIYVIPNFIDLTLYDIPRQGIKKTNDVVIGFFGSTSHQADLYEKHFVKAIMQVRRENPNVRFEILGNYIPGYLDSLNAKLIPGDSDMYGWIKLWKEVVCKWDIGVAPLRDTPFNRSRSDIKFQEYGAARIPMVASDVGIYNNEYALLAKNTNEWYRHLTQLVTDEVFRRNTGSDALHEIALKYSIQNNWRVWKEVFEDIHERNKTKPRVGNRKKG